MTLEKLLDEAYALGFESEGEIDESFIFAANRALRQIYSELSCEVTGYIIASSMQVLSHTESYVHLPKSSFIQKICGEAYSFKASGEGRYIITDKDGTKELAFSGKRCECRGYIHGEGTITFLGDYSYTVYDITCFAEKRSDKVSDIPLFSQYTEYRLREYLPDLCRVSGVAKDSKGETVRGAVIRTDVLILPSDFSGEVRLTYQRLPRVITVDDRERELDIDPSIAYLLPILTASYIWLDDDEEKAAYYMGIYNDEASRLKSSFPKLIDNGYNDVTGWG